jgi:hypothetical protein
MTKYNFEIFADYFQFYLQDETLNRDISDSWTEEALANLLVATPQVVAVGTARNTTVPVEIDVLSAPPVEDFSAYDKVNECSLELPSGRLVVMGTTDYFPDAPRITVLPGTYRMRIYYKNLENLSEDGLDGEDSYTIMLWPQSTYEPMKILR